MRKEESKSALQIPNKSLQSKISAERSSSLNFQYKCKKKERKKKENSYRFYYRREDVKNVDARKERAENQSTYNFTAFSKHVYRAQIHTT